jgi:ABC-type branched-subunit amino acid transport system substrate-binding protein
MIGDGIKNGIQLAAEKYPNVKVVYEDDQFDAQKGITAFLKLRDIDKVKAVINVTPGTADAIMPLLEKK